jgi:hypothetical protein
MNQLFCCKFNNQINIVFYYYILHSRFVSNVPFLSVDCKFVRNKFTAPLLTVILAGKETALVFPLAVSVPETTLLPLAAFNRSNFESCSWEFINFEEIAIFKVTV